MSVYIKYRLGWYDFLAAPSWGRELKAKIAAFGRARWLFTLGLLGLVNYAIWLGWHDGLMMPSIMVLFHAVTDFRLFGLSLIILSLMIIAFDRLEDSSPLMKISILNVFIKERSDGENVMLWASTAPLLWWLGFISLILSLGYFTTLEETYFRNYDNWLVQVLPVELQDMMQQMPMFGALFWGVLVFGLVHLYSGARLGDCLALGLVGGGWFAWQAATGGLHLAAVSHANYNLLAITYTFYPPFQTGLRRAINAMLEEFGRKPLKSVEDKFGKRSPVGEPSSP